MTIDFCPGTRWLQIKRGAVAITPDERVYLVRGGRAVELVAQADPAASDEQPSGEGMGMAVSQEGDGS